MANFAKLTLASDSSPVYVNLDCVASMSPATTGTATVPSHDVTPNTLQMLDNSGPATFVVKEKATDIIGMLP